jgi:Fibronectin type III domain
MRLAVVSLILVLGVTACGGASPQQSLSGTESSHPQSSTGSAVLNWNPVTEDTSGNPLEGLAGYKIHYGTSVDAMDTLEVLNDPSQTTYIVYGLSPGTWYFAASAYTTDGTESALSDVASKTIN